MTMPRIMLIILILNLLITLGGVAGNYWLLHDVDRHPGAVPAQAESQAQAASVAEVAISEYQFFPVEKIIVSVRGADREHYLVLDLVLQADKSTPSKQVEQLDPIVRNSTVSHLSGLSFETLRELSVAALQEKLEAALRQDLSARNIGVPFSHLMVSKLIVQ